MHTIKLPGGDYINESMWSVYVHTNKINNKKYVGITSQPVKARWLNGTGYETRLKFGRAIQKYGWDNFNHDVLFTELTEQEAKEIEQKLILELNTQDDNFGYNMTAGGDGINGYHHSDISRKKMSQSKSGINHPNYGKHRSEETCQKISEKLKNNSNPLGCVRSEDTKKKMSDSKKKPIEMYYNGVFQRVFDSAKDAEALTGVNRKNISSCCLGYRPRAGGYEWKFA